MADTEFKVKMFYHHDIGCIVYEKGDLSIGCMLSKYDDAIRIVDFNKGLLTILMKKGSKEVEEYVDFKHALALLYMSKSARDYFDGVTADDIVLEKVG